MTFGRFMRTQPMCTTIIVGEHATVDGSFLVARSADSSSLKAQHFVIHPAVTASPRLFLQGARRRERLQLSLC